MRIQPRADFFLLILIATILFGLNTNRIVVGQKNVVNSLSLFSGVVEWQYFLQDMCLEISSVAKKDCDLYRVCHLDIKKAILFRQNNQQYSCWRHVLSNYHYLSNTVDMMNILENKIISTNQTMNHKSNQESSI